MTKAATKPTVEFHIPLDLAQQLGHKLASRRLTPSEHQKAVEDCRKQAAIRQLECRLRLITSSLSAGHNFHHTRWRDICKLIDEYRKLQGDKT